MIVLIKYLIYSKSYFT